MNCIELSLICVEVRAYVTLCECVCFSNDCNKSLNMNENACASR